MNTQKIQAMDREHSSKIYSQRIPNIIPIRKQPNVIPKIQSNFSIHSKFRMREEYQHKFETDQDVYTEQECARVSTSSREGELSRKNSFVNTKMHQKHHKKRDLQEVPNNTMHNCRKGQQKQKRRQNVFSYNSSISSANYYENQQTDNNHQCEREYQEQCKDFNGDNKIKKELGFYLCDSLCIRPNPNPTAKTTKTVTIDLQNDSDPQQMSKVISSIQPIHDTTNTTIFAPSISQQQQACKTNPSSKFYRNKDQGEHNNNGQRNQQMEKQQLLGCKTRYISKKTAQQLSSSSLKKSYKTNQKQEERENRIQQTPSMLERSPSKNTNRSLSKKIKIFQPRKNAPFVTIRLDDHQMLSSLSNFDNFRNKLQKIVVPSTRILHTRDHQQLDESQNNNRIWTKNQMHIVFQTDQITQCCL